MPGDVTTNVTAVVTVVDKTAVGTASINKNLAAIEQTVKSINANVAHSLDDIAKAAPGNIWNFPVRGDAIVPDIATPANIQAVKVGGVFDRLQEKIVGVASTIKARLGGAFDEVWSVASGVLARLTSGLTSFGGLFAAGFGIGTAIDTLVGGMTDLVNTVDKLKPQADALGVTVGKLQDFTQWAKEAGQPVDRVVAGLENLSRVSAGVAEGAKGYDRAAEAFKRLNVSVVDADTGKLRSIVDMMPEIATGFQNIADPGERAKVAYDALGKSWQVLLPMFMQGPEALKKAEDDATAIGKLSDAQVEAALKYKDALNQLGPTITALKESLGGELLPVVTPALQELTKFLQDNKGDIAGGFKIGVDGLVEAFRQLDAVVKSTNDDIQGIKAGWDWLQKPITVPEWFGGPKATQAGGQATSTGGGPLTPEDLAGSRGGPIVGPANGTVNVIIDNRNPPPGQSTNATATGKGVKVDVGQSMPWSSPEYSGPWAAGHAAG
jgi:hypothetical protein